jgi:hypothetical protein
MYLMIEARKHSLDKSLDISAMSEECPAMAGFGIQKATEWSQKVLGLQ